MPSSQKTDKESLMRLLFKVNENWRMLTVVFSKSFSDPERFQLLHNPLLRK